MRNRYQAFAFNVLYRYTEAEARACFTENDKDGSDTINAAELAAVLTTLG